MGVRFSHLADKDEHQRDSLRDSNDEERDKKIAKIDDLIAHQKFALVESLHQLQAEMSVLTREYHVMTGGPVQEPQLAADVETRLFVEYWSRLETKLYFILINLEKYGFETDAEITTILSHGCHTVHDIDHIARGLHRMMVTEQTREWR